MNKKERILKALMSEEQKEEARLEQLKKSVRERKSYAEITELRKKLIGCKGNIDATLMLIYQFMENKRAFHYRWRSMSFAESLALVISDNKKKRGK